MKKVVWLGGSYGRFFPAEVRSRAGQQLNQVQHGRMPDEWKPILNVGAGVMEIRIHEPHEHRIMSVAKFEEAVYVLHAFEKKTQQTSKQDLKLARTAYAELKKIRRENG